MASPEPQPLVDDPSPPIGERSGSRPVPVTDGPSASGRATSQTTTAARPESVRAVADVASVAVPEDRHATKPLAVTDPSPVVADASSGTAEVEPDVEFWGEERKPRGRKNKVGPAPDTDSPETGAAAAVAVVQAETIDAKALGRLKARKVRRIVRHISPWSVFKVSLLFYICLWLILMVASVILWRVAQQVGVVTNVEDFYAELMGKEFYEFDGRRMFRGAAVIGGILAVAATGFTVLMTILFNVISDFTGGIRVSVIELEEARRETRTRRRAKTSAPE